MLISKLASADASPELVGVEKTHPAAARRAAQLPFRIVVASDLCPPAPGVKVADAPPLFRVDKSTFAEALARLSPGLDIDVPDRVGGRAEGLEISLRFGEMRAFEPAGIAAQVPVLADVMTLREHITSLRNGDVTPESFARAVGALRPEVQRFAQVLIKGPASAPSPPPPAAPPAHPAGEGQPLSRLLDLVDLEAQPTPPPTATPAALADALTRNLSAPTAPGVDRAAATAIVAELDRVLAQQINEILHHSHFQALEAAWRGLYFLVSRLDFRSTLKVEVLATSRADVVAALHAQVLDPALSGEEETPVSLVVIDAFFDRSLADLERLAEIADLASALPAPVVSGASPALLGAETAAGIDALPVMIQHFQGTAFVHWNALRADAASAPVALALPRFLLRPLYGPDWPVKAFPFEESGQGKPASYLWGNAALAVAAAVADAYVRTGLPVRFTFPEPEATIDDLPVAHLNAHPTVLEATFRASRQQELVEAGFTVLGTRLNSDSAFVVGAPTIRKPVTYDVPEATTEARLHATLACQLLATQAAHLLLAASQEASGGQQEEEALAADLEARLQSWLAAGGHIPEPGAVTVEVVHAEGTMAARTLAVRLHTPAPLLGQSVGMVMHVPLAD